MVDENDDNDQRKVYGEVDDMVSLVSVMEDVKLNEELEKCILFNKMFVKVDVWVVNLLIGCILINSRDYFVYEVVFGVFCLRQRVFERFLEKDYVLGNDGDEVNCDDEIDIVGCDISVFYMVVDFVVSGYCIIMVGVVGC